MPETYQKIANSGLIRTWANDPPPDSVEAPPDGITASGWTGLQSPPADWINYLYQLFGEKLNHCLQNGIPLWIATKAYAAGNVATHSGLPWLATATNTNSAPTLSNANWLPLASGRGITGSMYSAHGADVTITTTAAAVPVNTNIHDSAGTVDHDTSTNNSRFSVTRAGIYEYAFNANVLSAHASPDNVYFYVAKNGTALPNSAVVCTSKSLGTAHQVTVAGTIPLVANDYIELFVKADTNGHYTLDFTATAGGVPAVPSVVVNIKGW